jgi:mono/diheme cytochrome c family protein
MPHFSESQISDQAITDIHAYLTALPEPANFTPAQANLPADAPPGQQLIVQKRCVACHTETGPIPGFVKRGEAPTVEYVLHQVRQPFKYMPSFSESQVSDAEVGQIVDFLNIEFTQQVTQTQGTQAQPSTQQQPSAQQQAPATLPTSGASASTVSPWFMLGVGVGLLLLGISLHRLVIRRA